MGAAVLTEKRTTVRDGLVWAFISPCLCADVLPYWQYFEFRKYRFTTAKSWRTLVWRRLKKSRFCCDLQQDYPPSPCKPSAIGGNSTSDVSLQEIIVGPIGSPLLAMISSFS